MSGILAVLAAGVTFLVDHSLLPAAAVFIEPAKVLFLNNAINHGVFTPIATIQAAISEAFSMVPGTTGCPLASAFLAAISLWASSRLLPPAIFTMGAATRKEMPAAMSTPTTTFTISDPGVYGSDQVPQPDQGKPAGYHGD